VYIRTRLGDVGEPRSWQVKLTVQLIIRGRERERVAVPPPAICVSQADKKQLGARSVAIQACIMVESGLR